MINIVFLIWFGIIDKLGIHTRPDWRIIESSATIEGFQKNLRPYVQNVEHWNIAQLSGRSCFRHTRL